LNSGVAWPMPKVAEARVLGIQRKLHKWAEDDQARRFKDLHNLVCDPATLLMAWQRVRGNRGSRSAGVDGLTAHEIEAKRGVEQFLSKLREELRTGTFRPLPVKERAIPKRSGKLRYLGIPAWSSASERRMTLTYPVLDRALVIVSSVVNVFDEMMKRVPSAARSRVASAKSVESTSETKRKVRSLRV
jgi:hypothetical protein